MVNQEIKELIG